MVKLATALLRFGSPAHKIETQLGLCAVRLQVNNCKFIHYPNVILCCFGDEYTGAERLLHVRAQTKMSIGQLHKLHALYKDVLRDEKNAVEATEEIQEMLNAKPIWGRWWMVLWAFCLSALICPIAFGGSFLDMWLAGLGGAVLQFVALWVKVHSTVFE